MLARTDGNRLHCPAGDRPLVRLLTIPDQHSATISPAETISIRQRSLLVVMERDRHAVLDRCRGLVFAAARHTVTRDDDLVG